VKPPRSGWSHTANWSPNLDDELRRRGLTYRDIVSVLAGKCQVQDSASALRDFVRSRSWGRKKSSDRGGADRMRRGIWAAPGQKSSTDEEVRRVKAPQPVRKPEEDIDFDFDRTQPLHLITEDKGAADE
jgi:hypothetical protein